MENSSQTQLALIQDVMSEVRCCSLKSSIEKYFSFFLLRYIYHLVLSA